MKYYVQDDGICSKWYKDEEMTIFHREYGPAVEYSNGDKFWYFNNKRHREDGPAIEYENGTKYWYKNGYLHREDGPAVEYAKGGGLFFYKGKKVSENFVRAPERRVFFVDVGNMPPQCVKAYLEAIKVQLQNEKFKLTS